MHGSKPRITWHQAELRWLQEMSHKKSIIHDIRKFEWLQNHLGKMYLDEIDKIVIQNIAEIKEKEGNKPSTVNRTLALIRSVLSRACKNWEWLDTVPRIELRKEGNFINRWLTHEEAIRLIKNLPTHLSQMVRFSLSTGLRAKNVSDLKWQDVDMFRAHMVVHPDKNKTKKFLGVPLNSDAIQVLKEVSGNHPEYVFTYKGIPIQQVNTKAWRKALKRADIKNFRWHDLRHTWASWHVQSGTSLQELCELGGWGSMAMVLRYAHLSGKQLIKAADRISLSGAELVQKKLHVVR